APPHVPRKVVAGRAHDAAREPAAALQDDLVGEGGEGHGGGGQEENERLLPLKAHSIPLSSARRGELAPESVRHQGLAAAEGEAAGVSSPSAIQLCRSVVATASRTGPMKRPTAPNATT